MGIEHIQNLYIPRSVKYIDECTFYHLKKLVILNCDEKWEDEKYFPFLYKIEFGTTIIDRNIFKEWFNLRSLSIPSTVNTILPFTFSDCLGIVNLNYYPKYFKFLNVRNIKVLVLPEGVERLEKGSLKGFVNLIF